MTPTIIAIIAIVVILLLIGAGLIAFFIFRGRKKNVKASTPGQLPPGSYQPPNQFGPGQPSPYGQPNQPATYGQPGPSVPYGQGQPGPYNQPGQWQPPPYGQSGQPAQPPPYGQSGVQQPLPPVTAQQSGQQSGQPVQGQPWGTGPQNPPGQMLNDGTTVIAQPSQPAAKQPPQPPILDEGLPTIIGSRFTPPPTSPPGPPSPPAFEEPGATVVGQRFPPPHPSSPSPPPPAPPEEEGVTVISQRFAPPPSPSAPTVAALLVKQGEQAGQRFPLKEYNKLGRSKERNDISLVDRTMSREHIIILRENNQWILEDLGSDNGTMVNGTRVNKRQVLHNGDQIAIGLTILTFEN